MTSPDLDSAGMAPGLSRPARSGRRSSVSYRAPEGSRTDRCSSHGGGAAAQRGSRRDRILAGSLAAPHARDRHVRAQRPRVRRPAVRGAPPAPCPGPRGGPRAPAPGSPDRRSGRAGAAAPATASPCPRAGSRGPVRPRPPRTGAGARLAGRSPRKWSVTCRALVRRRAVPDRAPRPPCPTPPASCARRREARGRRTAASAGLRPRGRRARAGRGAGGAARRSSSGRGRRRGTPGRLILRSMREPPRSATEIQTSPTGFSSVPPSGPATPVMPTPRSASSRAIAPSASARATSTETAPWASMSAGSTPARSVFALFE